MESAPAAHGSVLIVEVLGGNVVQIYGHPEKFTAVVVDWDKQGLESDSHVGVQPVIPIDAIPDTLAGSIQDALREDRISR